MTTAAKSSAAASTTAKPTKRYTIHPVRTTEKTTVMETDTTLESESTETVADMSEETTGTTFSVPSETTGSKETAPTLSTVAESRATDGGTASTSTAETSTPSDAADSREGYLPLRDKPQQTHVKINEQTKKEVSNILDYFRMYKTLVINCAKGVKIFIGRYKIIHQSVAIRHYRPALTPSVNINFN